MTTQNARYQHAQRDTEALAVSNLKKRELRWAGDTKRLVGKLQDDTVIYGDGYSVRYVDRFSTVAAAITAFGPSSIHAKLAKSVTLTANATFAATTFLDVLKGGLINLNGFTLTINGPFRAGRHQVFSGAGSVVFASDSVSFTHPEWFNAFSTPALRTAALALAVAAHDCVLLPSGTYDPYDLSSAGKTLLFDPGVVFKVPNGHITTTPGTPAFSITGSDIALRGDFECDGNYANQNVAGFSSTQRTGTFAVLGSSITHVGTITISDSFWVGVQFEGGSTSGSEITQIHLDRVVIDNPRYYSFMPWSVNGWSVRSLRVTAGADSTDARVRTGTQTITAECLNGYIGHAQLSQSLVCEKRTRQLHIDKLTCGTFKCEDSADVSVDSAYITGQFYDQRASRIRIGTLISTGFNNASEPNVNINTSLDAVAGDNYTGGGLSIGTLILKDAVAATNSVQVRTALNLDIGSIIIQNQDASIAGILFDYDVSYAPQNYVRIGSIYAYGHSGYDLEVQNNWNNLHIGQINSTAVISNSYGGPMMTSNANMVAGDGIRLKGGSLTCEEPAIFGNDIIAATTLDVAMRDALPTNSAKSFIYTTIGGGVFPFDAYGNLVLQCRSSSPRDIVFMSGSTSPTPAMVIEENAASRIRLERNLLGNQGIKSAHPTQGMGYTTGAGGTVAQGSGSGKATGVTLNKATGQITMDGAALAAGAAVSFTLTNSAIAAADVLQMNNAAGGTPGAYSFDARCGAGSALITVRNLTAGSLSEAVVIAFVLHKGATA